ncbi:prephenate dehydratase PHA2 KNAG_0K02520 [Huiozyma naganishii CBS 8797]|uniref:prephenate dehydratase n=1 Tax=Huiozyma naganishii (strain ATCC MYA-139 / BCRC 22969 / CBS 8797 / KCTC 17520 / NBRC 10181 / NCYC 3082 / Yp74L-3) TaxID=1071383 RepID=J7RCL9_HUIN7|nr:hypothetical protein KNAG_0K02520 [Kazachstania naganishii CBS 8797]CCK72615.1 hypothetical protein KNAG_0K02520 [Kazachstania naganishii CBS 8797]
MVTTNVMFLGPPGTYSHQAALQQFSSRNDVKYTPASSIPQCFDELERNNDVDYSVVPLENSTNGQVVFSYDLLRDRMLDKNTTVQGNQKVPKLEIVGEQYVSITHCLLSSVELQGTDGMDRFKRVRIFSHPQVWGQVSEYLSKLKRKHPNVKFETADCTSTSDAALKAREEQAGCKDTETLFLAIASETAATLYDLNIVDHSINDKLGNTTRFLVLRRHHQTSTLVCNDGTMYVSLITFTIEQDDPGSLVDMLTVLKKHAVNMCSIHSRPYNSSANPRKWQYIFYVEYDYDPKKQDWDEFYKQLSGECMQWCLWGTFPRNHKYYQ